MANNDIRSKFVFEESGAKEVSRRIGAVSKDMETLRREAQQTNTELDSLRQSSSGIGSSRGSMSPMRSAGRANQAFQQVSNGLGNVTNAALDAANVMNNGGGLLDTLGALSQATPVTAAVFAGFSTALNVFQREAAASAAELGNAIDAQRELDQRIVDGLTSSEAVEEMERINELRELERVRLERLEEGWDQMGDTFGDLTGVVAELQPQVGAARDELAESRAIVEQYDNQIENLTEAMDEGRLSANDAEAAESELASSRADGEQATRDAEKAQREQEQSQERVEQATRDANEAMQDAATGFAQASQDIRTETKRAQADTKREAKRANRDAVENAKTQAEQSGRAYFDTQRQNQLDFQRVELADRRQHERDIRDIYRDANRAQADLLAERNFLQVDLLSRQTRRELEDVGIGAQDVKEERDIAFQQELEDLRNQHAIENRERGFALRDRLRQIQKGLRDELSDLRRAGQRKLEDARTFLERELEMARTALQRKLELESQYWQASTAMAGRGSGAGGFPSSSNTTNNTYGGNNVNYNPVFNGAGQSNSQLQNMMIGTLRDVGLID